MIYTKRGSEDDKLPKVDWVMERQFPEFFALLGIRYEKIKDVTPVIDSGHYR